MSQMFTKLTTFESIAHKRMVVGMGILSGYAGYTYAYKTIPFCKSAMENDKQIVSILHGGMCAGCGAGLTWGAPLLHPLIIPSLICLEIFSLSFSLLQKKVETQNELK